MFIFRLPKIPPTNQPPRKGGVSFIPCVALDFVSDRNYRRTFLLLSRKKDFFRKARLLEEGSWPAKSPVWRGWNLLYCTCLPQHLRRDLIVAATQVTGAGLYKNVALGFRFM
jgi:hypothetical protein